MTRDEAKEVIKKMTYAYPSFKPVNISEMVDVWAEMFVDVPFVAVVAALKTYVATDTSGFAPSVGKIFEIIRTFNSVQNPDLSDLQAWSLVSKAIKNSLYNSQEMFNSLPPVVQKAVGSPDILKEWAQLDSQEVGTVIQSQFLRSFRTEQKRDSEYKTLPSDIRTMLETKGLQNLLAPPTEQRQIGGAP